MPHPMDDVIVVLPGILGSTLYRDDAPVWEPRSAALFEAIKSLLRSIKQLELPDGVGDEHPGDTIEARRLMPDLRLPLGVWTFDLGYSALLSFLRSTFSLVEQRPNAPEVAANLIIFPYDWRLSNRYNGQRLRDTIEPVLQRWRDHSPRHADAKFIFICHSMGGLVARWFLDRLGGAEFTAKLITLGTPHRGALNALDQLGNGVRKGPGLLRVNLTAFARSLPSMHQLLPEYACIERGQELAKITEVPNLPTLSSPMVRDAMAFHMQIDEARVGTQNNRAFKHTYQLYPILGYQQPTWTTARINGSRFVPIRTIGGSDERGDATVPRLSTIPPDIKPDSGTLHHIANNHAGLVHSQAVFDELEGILTANPVIHRAGQIRVAADIPEVLDHDERLLIRAELLNEEHIALEAVVADHTGSPIEVVRLARADEGHQAEPDLPGPGIFQVTVRGVGAARHQVIPITTGVTVWPPESAFHSGELA